MVGPAARRSPSTLLATITVTAPTGGTVYVGQPVADHVDDRRNLTGTLALSYSADGGTTWTAIAVGPGRHR